MFEPSDVNFYSLCGGRCRSKQREGSRNHRAHLSISSFSLPSLLTTSILILDEINYGSLCLSLSYLFHRSRLPSPSSDTGTSSTSFGPSPDLPSPPSSPSLPPFLSSSRMAPSSRDPMLKKKRMDFVSQVRSTSTSPLTAYSLQARLTLARPTSLSPARQVHLRSHHLFLLPPPIHVHPYLSRNNTNS